MLELDIESGEAREFLYQLEDKGHGISEILAVNDHQFLVLERDGKAGVEAAFKKVFLIDIAAATDPATDIRAVKQLPKDAAPLPAGVVAVKKTVFLDLLHPDYKRVGASFPEKIEGLAFGPDLEDGRHLLIVTNDNDFAQGQESRFLAFAIPQADLPGFEPQQFSDHRGAKCRKEGDDD